MHYWIPAFKNRFVFVIKQQIRNLPLKYSIFSNIFKWVFIRGSWNSKKLMDKMVSFGIQIGVWGLLQCGHLIRFLQFL